MDSTVTDSSSTDTPTTKRISTSGTSQGGSTTACGKSVCTKKIVSKSKAVSCDHCQQWWHMQCAEIDEATYKVLSLTNSSEKGIFWLCLSCRPKATFIFESKNIISRETQEIKTQVKKLENSLESKLKALEQKFFKKVDTQQNHLDKNIQSFADVVKNKLEPNSKTSSALDTLNNEVKTLKTNIQDNINTEKERMFKKSKANNIIMFNVPESKGVTQEAYKNDVEKVKSVLAELDLEISNKFSVLVNLQQTGPGQSL